MTYQRFKPYFEPNGFEHRALANVHKGELTEVITVLPGSIVPLIRNVEATVKLWKKVHSKNHTYLEISTEEVSPDAHVIQAFLTNAGLEALSALSLGYVWDRDKAEKALVKTAEFYDYDIKRGYITEHRAQALLALARTEPALRETRARFVYLRMQGELNDGIYRNRPPVIA